MVIGGRVVLVPFTARKKAGNSGALIAPFGNSLPEQKMLSSSKPLRQLDIPSHRSKDS